ncbi:hypothetical protein SRABI128_04291 [Microbacterium sp. Bi128]|nr:hypothetical protein SRABI128_04291 [Microbacterium sp. Bi128]
MRSTHATTSETPAASRMTQVGDPSTIPSTEAMTTPTITPTLRSTARVKDWLMLGCTTRTAAIAAKIGGGPGTSRSATIQAATIAAADLATWRNGPRRGERNVRVSRGSRMSRA